MTGENGAVGEAEFVLRRIPLSFVREELPVPVLRVAFEPNQHDTTGISVYRERFVIAVDRWLAGYA